MEKNNKKKSSASSKLSKIVIWAMLITMIGSVLLSLLPAIL
ncbi:DUF4044 domain-containing protein [Atopococcus tabaci]|nr:DUF4044 domain-containing protein [Atopococcus tabaci]